MTVDRNQIRLPLAVFLVVTFGGSAAVSIAFATTGGASGPLASAAVIAMFLPAVAVLCVRLALRAPVADLGWHRFPVRWLSLALLVFPVAIHALGLP